MVEKLNEEDKKRVLNVHYTMPPVRVTEFMTSTFTDPAIFPFLEEKHREVGLLPATARKESTGYVFLPIQYSRGATFDANNSTVSSSTACGRP